MPALYLVVYCLHPKKKFLMKEKLQIYALIAEITGSIAIVISLVFVGYQMKQNTNAMYAISYDNLLSDQFTWRMDIAKTPALIDSINANDIYAPGIGLKDFQLAVEANTQIYERAYLSYYRGVLGEEEWQRFDGNLCGVRLILERMEINLALFSRVFTDYMISKDCLITENAL